MTLVFIAKGMAVEDPIEYINLNPLPNLPSGLSHAFLFRHSLAASGINLATNEPSGMLEYGDGSFTYRDNSALADPRRAGWEVPGWSYEKGSPITFMAIGTSVDVGNESNILLSIALEASPPTFDISLRSDGAYGTLRNSSAGGAINVKMDYAGGPPTTTPVILFCSVDSSYTVTVFEPSSQAIESGVLAEMDEMASSGLVYIAPGTQPNNPKNFDTYMAAGWSRELSQGEMTDAYDALKPWLASRGVVIA